MAANTTRIIARIAWILPVFFFGLFVHQTRVAYSLRATLLQGQPAEAQVLEVHQENRVDVTYDYTSLRVELPGGRVITKEKMSIPHSLIQLLEDRQTVPVRVRPGSSQEVVIEELGPTQWRIAAMNAAIAFGAAMLFGLGVFFWGRYQREGTSSARSVADGASSSPVHQATRA